MISIKEAARITGIAEQNIRYYEKQKLLTPGRNAANSYREYTGEDLRRLKLIRLFRSLDMPISEIRKLFKDEISLQEAVNRQCRRLKEERDKLDNAFEFCSSIHESSLSQLDVDAYLDKMEREEKKGSVFSDFAKDYLAVIKSEMKREFSFMPEAMCGNPREFTDELLKFARHEGMNIVITQESLSPRFEIDGVEYRAYRTSGRFGITVHCEMVHPEDYIPEGMQEKKYYRYRFLSIIALPVLIFVTANLWLIRDMFSDWESIVIFAGALAVFIANLCFLYYCYGKNYKG